MIIKYKNASYISEAAHAKGEGFDEYCYNADGKPCAFLGADGCHKPPEVPACAGEGQRSVVWIRHAAEPFRTRFVMHPTKNHECFCCGNFMPGRGSPNAQTDALREVGCAHFVLNGKNSKGELVEWRICCVCYMALCDLGHVTAKSGMFRLAMRRANPKSKETRAWENAYKDASRTSVMDAMRRRGLAAEIEEN